MKIFSKLSIIGMAFAFIFGLAGLNGVFAATTPSLGTADTFGVLSSTFTVVTSTTVNGDVGYTVAGAPTTAPTVNGTIYPEDATWTSAGLAQGTALTNLNNQPCTYTFPDTAINLSTDTTHGTVGVYAPGVYCTQATRAASIGTAGITLTGSGTFIFRINGAFTSVDGAVVTLANGASSCDVFWTPTAATTLGANNTFVGTVIDDAGITVGANTAWTGRALAYGGTVTTNTDTITRACSVSTVASSGSSRATINVVKTVINDNGGTKKVVDFPLFVNGSAVISGETNTFIAPASAFTITETNNANYTRAFSGDCDINGQLNLIPGDNRFCIVTNNDIGAPLPVLPVPPLMDLVKTANPLSLPAGPGSVTYTYTLRNIGTVPVTDITIVGDTCSPIVLVSGDTNNDKKLDLNETWVHTCQTNLTETHTNTAVATGWANGISTVDIATATVVVGTPIVPPLIHITKVPTPFTLPAGGGMVTYVKTVTNPGTVALSNVRVTDNQCSPVSYITGDANGDSKLDPSETWMYTCRVNIMQTTTNTAVATGEANGMTARDFAIASIVVGVPGLSNAGIESTSWWIIALIAIVGISFSFYIVRRKQLI
ncbi:MAG: ice-binding family protein [Candidatus Paceibacterota bacterium]|jgi:uncharacterized repeat protein (TIGR01451 family)